MGHKFDSDTATGSDAQINRRIHLQNNIWRSGILVSHRTSFTDTNHYMRRNPSLYTSSWTYCQDGDSYSDGIRTESDEDVSFSWTPEVASCMTVEDEQKAALERFLTKNQIALRRIAHLVKDCEREHYTGGITMEAPH